MGSLTETQSSQTPSSSEALTQSALVRLYHDENTTTEVARTISLAFSADPLVVYCRPGAEVWGTLGDDVMAWQKQRVKVSMVTSMVAGIAGCDAGWEAVAILHPPKSILKQSWPQAFTAWTLQVSSWLWPIDGSIDEQRMDQVRVKHEEAIQKVQKLIGGRDIWYLEVVAVRPERQGLRLGAKLMEAIKAEVKDGAILLESTSSASKRFYERQGFEVVGEVVLGDPNTTDSVLAIDSIKSFSKSDWNLSFQQDFLKL